MHIIESWLWIDILYSDTYELGPPDKGKKLRKYFQNISYKVNFHFYACMLMYKFPNSNCGTIDTHIYTC